MDDAQLQEILQTLKQKCHDEDIFLPEMLTEAGAAAAGTISTSKFKSTLVGTFRTFHFTEQLLNGIVGRYGCGYKAPLGTARDIQANFEMVEWKMFCDDIADAGRTADGGSGGLKYAPRAPRGCNSFAEAEASKTRSRANKLS